MSSRGLIGKAAIKSAVDLWVEVGKYSRLRIAGRSMVPFLRDGWTVTVEHTRENIRRGDVIAYHVGERVVVHRVVRLLADGRLLTKGDWRLRFDRPVALEQIIGRVVAVITTWGSINLTAPWWRMAQSLLACASYIAGWVSAWWIR